MLVLVVQIFVSELLTVDGLATSAVTVGKITTLEHKLGNNTMEGGALEVEGLA